MKNLALIIEDNLGDSLVTQSVLEALGFECVCAEDGEAAIKYITSITFDLIALDMQMPNINGMQFLKGFRTAPLAKEVPVVVVSGTESEETIEFAQIFGAAQVLPKPLSLGRDRESLSQYLKKVA